MRNDAEETLYIDTNKVCQKLGMKNDPWFSYGQGDVELFFSAIEQILERNPHASTVQLAGLFPVEIALRLGAVVGRAGVKLEYSRPGIRRVEIFDHRGE